MHEENKIGGINFGAALYIQQLKFSAMQYVFSIIFKI